MTRHDQLCLDPDGAEYVDACRESARLNDVFKAASKAKADAYENVRISVERVRRAETELIAIRATR